MFAFKTSKPQRKLFKLTGRSCFIKQQEKMQYVSLYLISETAEAVVVGFFWCYLSVSLGSLLFSFETA